MPLDHSRATATISVTGLALGCLNPATRNWEVALIRAPRHVLRITVNKVAADGTSSDLTFEVDNQHRIFITAANAVVPQNQLYKAEHFDRLNPGESDLEDIRFLVDFGTEFEGSQDLELVPPNGNTSVTQLFVSQPTVYADAERQLDNMRLLNLTQQTERDFGTVAQFCNADIECNEGGAVILQVEGPLGFSMDLPRIAGRTHHIRIDNSCPAGAVPTGQPTDFNQYFSVVRLPSGETFDLRTVEGPQGSGAVCNKGIITSVDSVSSLGGN
jgi:hypothetical protein